METRNMVEEQEKLLLKKAEAQDQMAKEFSDNANNNAAIKCLKRKRLYEQQVENLGDFHLEILDQMIWLQNANVEAATNIDDINRRVDQINEKTETLKTIQDSLKNSVIDDYDEDELGAELGELEGEELKEELLQPAITTPSGPVHVPTPAGSQPARAAPQKRTAEEDELPALQAEEDEELKEELLQPAITAPSGQVHVPTPASRQPARAAPQKRTAEEDELLALQDEEDEELKEELPQPAITAPSGPVHVPTPASRQPARAAPQKRTAEEDELLALQAEEDEELKEELLQPAITAPSGPLHVPTPAGSQPARAAPQKRTAEEDELPALQAEEDELEELEGAELKEELLNRHRGNCS